MSRKRKIIEVWQGEQVSRCYDKTLILSSRWWSGLAHKNIRQKKKKENTDILIMMLCIIKLKIRKSDMIRSIFLLETRSRPCIFPSQRITSQGTKSSTCWFQRELIFLQLKLIDEPALWKRGQQTVQSLVTS